MSNKQIIKAVFDNEFNADKIRNQILLKSERKNKKNMIKFLKYAIPVFVLAIIVSIVFLNNNQNDYIFSDDTSNIIVNKINNLNLTNIDADIKLKEINNVNLPWYDMFNNINIPIDLDKFYGYGIYTKNNSNNEYDILNSYVYEYFNLDNNRKIKIAFSSTNKPIRDYFFDIDDAKESNINDNKLLVYQSEDAYFTKFKYNEYYFDIETHGISIDELISLLKSIIK